jgi:hypothetical protein
MMFAHAGEMDVPHQYHFIVGFWKRDGQVTLRIQVQTGEHFGIHVGYAARRVQQSRAIRVFAHGRKNCADRLFNGVDIYGAVLDTEILICLRVHFDAGFGEEGERERGKRYRWFNGLILTDFVHRN